jgi:hypothetical protein
MRGLALALALAACESRGAPPAPAPPAVSPEWTDFYGIQYKAPPGTNAHVTRSVLPGPGGEGGSPTDERPYVSLGMGGPRRFHLTITKVRGPETLDAIKASYAANGVGSGHTGVTTKTGWEMTYRNPRSDDPTKTSLVRLIYADIGGGHYECIYDEQNCADPTVAEAICRSIRAKP